MRHEVPPARSRATRPARLLHRAAGLPRIDLSEATHPCELTGALVIDRARGIGYCGLSERCDEAGATLMHDAFGLRATLMFDLAPGEYHTNVVLAVLAGRAALVCPAGFADPAVPEAIARLHGPHGIRLSPAEHAAFAGNAIALAPTSVWMSAGADAALATTPARPWPRPGFACAACPWRPSKRPAGRCAVAWPRFSERQRT